jgi:hypothetical protein
MIKFIEFRRLYYRSLGSGMMVMQQTGQWWKSWRLGRVSTEWIPICEGHSASESSTCDRKEHL